MSRPDDLRWVYAVQPALFVGACAAVAVTLTERLLLGGRLWENATFLLFVGAFGLTTVLVATWRIWRRELDPAAYRSARPLGYSRDHDWQYVVKTLVIVLAVVGAILLLAVWAGLLTQR